jgi:hypothetical protein
VAVVVVVAAALGTASVVVAGDNGRVNVSDSCRVPDMSCGGLHGSGAMTSGSSSEAERARAGAGAVAVAAVAKRSGMLPGGLEVQLRVHESQRSSGCASAASRIAAPSSHALVRCPGGRPPATEGGRLEMGSSSIWKPLAGIQSVFVFARGGEEERMSMLGAREKSVCVPEYTLGALKYVCMVRREGPRDTPRRSCSRMLRRMEVWRIDS